MTVPYRASPRARSHVWILVVRAVYAVALSVAASLGCALSRHKGYVVTWETTGPGIFCHDRDLTIAIENFEKSVSIENSLS